MSNRLWMVAIAVAFVAGYFVRGIAEGQIDKAQSITSAMGSSAQRVAAGEGTHSETRSHSSLKAAINPKAVSVSSRLATANVAAASAPRQDEFSSEPPSASSAAGKSAPVNSPNEIADEVIDKEVPAPFNKMLKNSHGVLRENYQPFLDADSQSAWDVKMQNKITDFMLGNAYSKFITLESMVCKANFCEMRVIETKRGSTGLIMSEMFMQDWWDIGAAQFTMDDSTDAIAMYGLMMKK